MRSFGLDPIVLEGCTTEQFIRFLVSRHTAPTTLIICSSREEFLQDFLEQLPDRSVNMPGQEGKNSATVMEGLRDEPTKRTSSIPSLLEPTLRLLALSRTVRVLFCADLTHLLAQLSVMPLGYHGSRTITSSTSGLTADPVGLRPILGILNPIRLHKPTSSFSAQGFNRTFASAVEAAHQLRQKLVLVESPELFDALPGDEGDVHIHHTELSGDLEDGAVQHPSSPWDQQLSMLNVTTKTFGIGERGWVGRTVSVRQVAERWCTFVKLGGNDLMQ